ncbi:50S ribosomal protein L7Ae [Candidatus Micrarchaeota archaeon]|nr:50S ribosomal protein L7Ae [Candidatus Micrarchaeota archaeon]
MAGYVKNPTPDEVKGKILEALSVVKDTGKLRKGVNEVTKAIEKKSAQLVIVAEDVQPEEVVMHIPILCEEKGIPCAFVNTRKELGTAAGLLVPTSSIAIENAGGGKEVVADIIKRLPKK